MGNELRELLKLLEDIKACSDDKNFQIKVGKAIKIINEFQKGDWLDLSKIQKPEIQIII